MIKGQESGSHRRLAIIGLALLAVYAVLDAVVASGILGIADVSLFVKLSIRSPSPILDYSMVLLSLYGRELFWGILIIGLFFLGKEREKKTALILVTLFIILTAVGYTAKALEYRPRPYEVVPDTRLLVPGEQDSSFPSGHTLIVMGGALVAWVRMRKRWASLLTVEAGLVAFSRIYVGVHYPTDIAGGTLLGVSCALLLCSRSETIDRLYDRLPVQLKYTGSSEISVLESDTYGMTRAHPRCNCGQSEKTVEV